MKNYYFTALLLGILSLTSCETEPIDTYLSGIYDSELNISSTDYLPRALNNEWQYKTNGVLDDASIKLDGSSVISGGSWFNMSGNLFKPFETTGTSYLRKVQNDYYVRFDNIITPTSTQSGYEIIVLKDNIVTNDTWTQEIQNTVTYQDLNLENIAQRIRIQNTVIAKDITLTVNGVIYSNVVNIKSEYFDASTNSPLYTFNTWFAKEIGVVRQIFSNDVITQTKVLNSYTIN